MADLLAAVAPDRRAEEFAVRVNRRPAGPDHPLRPGDRVPLSRLSPTAED